MHFSLMTREGCLAERETAGKDSDQELRWKRKLEISPGRKAGAAQREVGNPDAHVG